MENLTDWLIKNRMRMKEFCVKVGCSRTAIFYAKKGSGISKKFAEKIIEITKGEVVPLVRNKGRGGVIDISTLTKNI